MKAIYFSIIGYCMLAVALFSSCEAEETEINTEIHTCELRLLGGVDGYSDGTGTRSGYVWKNGSAIFLRFQSESDIVCGKAEYNEGKWTLTYQGALLQDGKCSAYHFPEYEYDYGNSIKIQPTSAIYCDEGAQYTYSDNTMTISSVLKPKFGRIRFKGESNEEIVVSGVTCCTAFDTETGEFTSSNHEINLKADYFGYTPYIYGRFNDEKKQLQLTLASNRKYHYQRTCNTTELEEGHSGYMLIPHEDAHENWEQIEHFDKWDGSRASEFAGGTGTATDPYLIETGAQLSLMRTKLSSYYKLIANIDLDNIPWPETPLTGVFDGNGCYIKNLKLTYNKKYMGFFSTLTGLVKNLTIEGVNIQAPDCDNIGAIVGLAYYATKNCHVIFTENSVIQGKTNVGGIVGYSEGSFENCTVSSKVEHNVIVGASNVGGIAGVGANIYNCHTNANIKASGYCGGIVGFLLGMKIENSSFVGNLSGSSIETGGILGYCERVSMIACKADLQNGNGNGFCGFAKEGGEYIACYSSGRNYTKFAAHRCGPGYSSERKTNVSLCYTTLNCNEWSNCIEEYRGPIEKYTATDCCAIFNVFNSSQYLSQNNCKNITEFLKGCASEYAKYWNFDNTWTWTGEIDGKQVSVSCPKLAWEE